MAEHTGSFTRMHKPSIVGRRTRKLAALISPLKSRLHPGKVRQFLGLTGAARVTDLPIHGRYVVISQIETGRRGEKV